MRVLVYFNQIYRHLISIILLLVYSNDVFLHSTSEEYFVRCYHILHQRMIHLSCVVLSFWGSEFFEFEDLSSSGSAAFLLFCLRLDVDFTKTLSKPPISLLLHPKKSNPYTEPNVKTYDILTKANKVRAIIVDIVAFLESIFLILENWIYTC